MLDEDYVVNSLHLSLPPSLQLSEALGPSDESAKHADASAMELLLLLQRLLLGIIYSHSPPDNEHKDSKYKITYIIMNTYQGLISL